MSELHIFVYLEMVLRILNTREIVKVPHQRGLALVNERVQLNHCLLVSGKLTEVKHVLQDLGNEDQVLTSNSGDLVLNNVVSVRGNNSQVNETIIDKVYHQLEDIVLRSISD
jgi:hypothetical protein